MMKKIVSLLCLFILCTGLLCACAPKNDNGTADTFNNLHILNGSTADIHSLEVIADGKTYSPAQNSDTANYYFAMGEAMDRNFQVVAKDKDGKTLFTRDFTKSFGLDDAGIISLYVRDENGVTDIFDYDADMNPATIVAYLPDANAKKLVPTNVEALTGKPQDVLDALAAAGALPDGIIVNDMKETTETVDGKKIHVLELDLSAPFGKAMRTTGTAGEEMYMGSLVNTFLRHFDADAVKITVDGEVLETGHLRYDDYLYFKEY